LRQFPWEDTVSTAPAIAIPSYNHDIFITRQPIYDPAMNAVAYELLFQNLSEEDAGMDYDDATTEVLINSLVEVGLPNIAENKQAFISISPKYIRGELPVALEETNVVLQIAAQFANFEHLPEQLQKLKKDGFPIALKNFTFDETTAAVAQWADYIKLDISRLTQEELEQQIGLLKAFEVTLIAEKVATQNDFARCKEMGFDQFQGYFFCEPNTIKGHRTPTSRLAVLHLLAEIQKPDVTFDDLEKLIAKDVTLSYRILRYINSAMYSLPRKIESIRHALTMLGLRAVKNWVTVLAQSKFDDKPYELMITSLLRARMCELLAEALSLKHDATFVVGLFSTLDALLDRSMEDVLKDLPLTEEVNLAILHKQGPLGEILRCAMSYEQGDWEQLPDLGLDNATVKNTYLEAIQWTREVGKEILSEAPGK
jgi:EAL and modified HD-GYP domain-containing signal transduction protein